jgi:anti-sigma-K factor RskA
LALFTEELARSEFLRALVLEYQNASTALPLSLGPVTPPAGLKSRVLAAATGEKSPRPAILTRLFWAAAAVLLFSFVVGNLFKDDYKPAGAQVQNPAPDAKGLIQWRSRSVKLALSGLPKLPSGKVYQLWHIGPEKDPVEAKTFVLDPQGLLLGVDTMKYDIAKGHAFALTMEPQGGSRKPTMPLYYVAPVN